jgi:hypothetical protein
MSDPMPLRNVMARGIPAKTTCVTPECGGERVPGLSYCRKCRSAQRLALKKRKAGR